MKCPACGNELTEIVVGDIRVDVCKGGCGGIWFDRWELMRVDEKSESAGEKLLDIERSPNVVINRGKRRCPRCENIFMMRHFFSVKEEIEVDECPKCGGFWLDAGELAKIRSQFETEEDRKNAAEKLFNSVFAPQLAKMRAQSEEKREKAHQLAKMLRWLCPSYYIPGDQDWGAF
ncbi:zf-TFIIB domain-containing protein [bacterium]|nr:zf-TFIIB domain-containing protein [bacterium]